LLISSDDVGAFERPCHGGSFSLRIPRSFLSSSVIDVDDAVMHLIPCRTEALRLLIGYASPLVDDLPLDTPHLRRTVVGHLHDLVALALGATRDAADVARVRGVRAARLKVAKTFVADNSSRRDLSVGAVAAHLGVTPRYVQRLFEGEDATFSSFLLERRLARARRMLTEPRFAQRAVSAIAYDVGFNDLSYFNRCFKQQYGATPRDIREAAND
jgi:AraC-like DNA-binding protein